MSYPQGFCLLPGWLPAARCHRAASQLEPETAMQQRGRIVHQGCMHAAEHIAQQLASSPLSRSYRRSKRDAAFTNMNTNIHTHMIASSSSRRQDHIHSWQVMHYCYCAAADPSCFVPQFVPYSVPLYHTQTHASEHLISVVQEAAHQTSYMQRAWRMQ